MGIRKLNLLLADDDAMQRQLFNGILRNYQLNSKIAPEINRIDALDGMQAVQFALAKDFDMIFLDIEMPQKSGMQALEEILKEKKQAYIVMLSGHGTTDNVKQAISKGAKGFIVKPYRINKITSVIDKYIQLTETTQ